MASKIKQIVEILFSHLNSIPKDKALHALYGLIIYSFIALYNPMIAILTVVLISVAKEIYDFQHKDIHTADWYDALATSAIPLVLYVVGLMI